MKVLLRGFLACMLVFLLTGAAFAQAAATDVQAQLDKLKKQVDEQKKQIESLQNTIKDMQGKQAAPAAPAAAPEVKVSSKYNLNIYGKVKFDGIYDTNNMGREDFILYVPKNASGEDRATFNVRDTRLGIAITGPSLHGWTPSGRFEVDFYGTDAATNGQLRMRVKPGLANIVTLIVLARYGWKMAAWVTVLRVLGGSLLLGNFLTPGFFLSISGAVCSLAVLAASQHLPQRWFGPVSHSILAAFAHIAEQLLVVFFWLIPHAGLAYLVPIFAASALLFGTVNGLAAAHFLSPPADT